MTDALKRSASQRVKEIFANNTLAVPDESAIRKNTESVGKFMSDELFALFDKKIGFNQETDDADNWPAKLNCLDVVATQIKLKHPGLWEKKIGEKQFVKMEIQNSLIRHFQLRRSSLRDDLKLKPKLKGTVHTKGGN